MILWSSILALLLAGGGDYEAGMRRCNVRYDLCVNDCSNEESNKHFMECRDTCSRTYNKCLQEVREENPSAS